MTIIGINELPDTYCVNLANAGIMSDDKVNNLGDEFLGCGLSYQKPYVLESIGSPRAQDQETDEDGTDGIDEPGDAASDNGHGQTEGVDHDIIAVVDEEDVN